MRKMEARCWATWAMIAFGAFVIAVPFLLPMPSAFAGFGTSPSVCKPGVFCPPPPPPPPSFALTLGVPVPEPEVALAPVEPDNGFGTSPSLPWAIQAGAFILGLMQLMKVNGTFKDFLSRDGWGFGVSLLIGAVTSFLVDYTTGRAINWSTAWSGIAASILASGGYSQAWLRFLKPALHDLFTKRLGWGWPAFLGEVKS